MQKAPQKRPYRVGLGLGSNLGDSTAQLVEAIRHISGRIGPVTHVSSLWRTPPWGFLEQPAFVNACALVETPLAPYPLLAALKSIEADMGRTPTQRWGPRAIDIDILFIDDLALEDSELSVPHKDLLKRAFVLAPLAEIAPDLAIGGRRVRDALADLDLAGLDILSRGDMWLKSNK